MCHWNFDYEQEVARDRRSIAAVPLLSVSRWHSIEAESAAFRLPEVTGEEWRDWKAGHDGRNPLPHLVLSAFHVRLRAFCRCVQEVKNVLGLSNALARCCRFITSFHTVHSKFQMLAVQEEVKRTFYDFEPPRFMWDKYSNRMLRRFIRFLCAAQRHDLLERVPENPNLTNTYGDRNSPFRRFSDSDPRWEHRGHAPVSLGTDPVAPERLAPQYMVTAPDDRNRCAQPRRVSASTCSADGRYNFVTSLH